MKVCEEFDTIQGEGKYLGVPSHFIRTTSCNLRCSWKNSDGSETLCDTAYTSWFPEKGTDLDCKQTLEDLSKGEINHIVITGGEPLIQQDLVRIGNLFFDSHYHVTIETNGTIYREGLSRAFMSISPKLLSSYPKQKRGFGIHKRNNIFISSIEKWISENKYQLKFVINEERDLSEVKEIVSILNINPDNVFLMPQGLTREQIGEKKDFIIKGCLENGFRYSPRLHIDLWGNVRGK